MYFNEQTARELTLVARLRAQKEKINDLRQALLSLMDKTRAEEGSVTYHLYADRDDPQNFIFHETWASQELWEKHMESPHIKGFFAGADALLDGEPTMYRLERSLAPAPVIDKEALVLFAYNRVKAGKEQAWQKILEDLIEPTLAENGCLHYELHRDREDARNFMFHESWKTVEAWNDHMQAGHLKALLKIIDDYTEYGIKVVKAQVLD